MVDSQQDEISKLSKPRPEVDVHTLHATPPERIFSTAGNTVTKPRSRPAGKHVETLSIYEAQ